MDTEGSGERDDVCVAAAEEEIDFEDVIDAEDDNVALGDALITLDSEEHAEAAAIDVTVGSQGDAVAEVAAEYEYVGADDICGVVLNELISEGLISDVCEGISEALDPDVTLTDGEALPCEVTDSCGLAEILE